MFDIGFWELTLIAVIALLVIGPERLPGAARTVGLWVGRIRRYVAHVREDIEREIQAEELKKLMDEPAQLGGLYDVVEETKGTLDEARRELEAVERDAAAGEWTAGVAEPDDSRAAARGTSADAAADADAAAPALAGPETGAASEAPAESPAESAPETPPAAAGDETGPGADERGTRQA